MIEFFHDLPYSGLLWTGLLAGLLASLACGVIGPYVITRRIVFLSGAIAHMAVGGAGGTLRENDVPGRLRLGRADTRSDSRGVGCGGADRFRSPTGE